MADNIQQPNMQGAPVQPQQPVQQPVQEPIQPSFDNSVSGKKDGQTKCPQCGATDISVNAKKGVLRCNYCRHEFQPEIAAGMNGDITKLQGVWVGKGASDIQKGEQSKQMLTLKCTSCGAEVVIDTKEATQARCHWCRNMLSIQNQIPNGAVPDAVLPFKLTKQQAQQKIEEFVNKRKFFANPKFKQEFTTDNIMGVYMPYMSINANTHVRLEGLGEIKTRQYTVKHGDNYYTYYDADEYKVGREYDAAIKGLTIESNTQRMSNDKGETNNIINSIMPFDMENCVQWDANYLHGYTSERRDTNVNDLKGYGDEKVRAVARYSINDTLGKYDRGVSWKSENINIIGEQWSAVYLPVWLYSYFEDKGNGQGIKHYVAVNARTQETMGSVPVYMPLLLGISAIIEVIGLILFIFMLGVKNGYKFSWLFLLPGLIYGFSMYNKYRNKNAKHVYETDTLQLKSNIKGYDTFNRKRKGLSNSMIEGCNNKTVNSSTANKVLNTVTGGNVLGTAVNIGLNTFLK